MAGTTLKIVTLFSPIFFFRVLHWASKQDLRSLMAKMYSMGAFPSSSPSKHQQKTAVHDFHIPGVVTTCCHCTIEKPKIWHMLHGENPSLGKKKYIAKRMGI